MVTCECTETLGICKQCKQALMWQSVVAMPCSAVSVLYIHACSTVSNPCLNAFILYVTQQAYIAAGSVCPHRDTPWVRYTSVPLLMLAAVASLFTDTAQRLILSVTGRRFLSSRASEQANSQTRPLGGQIDASDIAISLNPDGTQVLLGLGSSGTVWP